MGVSGIFVSDIAWVAKVTLDVGQVHGWIGLG